MVEAAASRPQAGAMAAFAGIGVMLLGASGVFGQLQESLNTIWKVTLRPDAGWGVTLRRRLLSFGMVGVIGPTAEQSLFGDDWWFDDAENWAHLVLGIVARISDYALGAGLVLGLTSVVLWFIEGRSIGTERVVGPEARASR